MGTGPAGTTFMDGPPGAMHQPLSGFGSGGQQRSRSSSVELFTVSESINLASPLDNTVAMAFAVGKLFILTANTPSRVISFSTPSTSLTANTSAALAVGDGLRMFFTTANGGKLYVAYQSTLRIDEVDTGTLAATNRITDGAVTLGVPFGNVGDMVTDNTSIFVALTVNNPSKLRRYRLSDFGLDQTVDTGFNPGLNGALSHTGTKLVLATDELNTNTIRRITPSALGTIEQTRIVPATYDFFANPIVTDATNVFFTSGVNLTTVSILPWASLASAIITTETLLLSASGVFLAGLFIYVIYGGANHQTITRIDPSNFSAINWTIPGGSVFPVSIVASGSFVYLLATGPGSTTTVFRLSANM